MTDQRHDAATPWRMTRGEWFAVAKRTWAETSADNVGLIAAGVAFYGFLALVPLLGAIVLIYGIVAEPATVLRDMMQLTAVMPADAAKLVGDQLMNVVKTSDDKKGLGLLLAIALALFGARNGAGAVITALNIAYEEKETRGFIRVNLLALAITAAAVLVAILALIAITALGHLEALFPAAPDVLVIAGKILVYSLLTLSGAAGAATLYRYGPSRQRAQWVWLTPGSLLAALLWLALTIGFGIYVANFGNYNATYGSLGAVVVTLTWLFLSSYILLFGAELNAELEHQTAHDTTTHTAAPLGERGAWVADHVARDPKAATPAANGPLPKPQSSKMRDFAASRAGARAGRVVGLPKVGWPSSIAATVGLALLRRGSGAPGAALLGGVAALAWLTRDRDTAPNQRIKAVFFDVDGTLVDSNDHHVVAWEAAFDEAGYHIANAAIHGQIGKGGDLLVPTLLPGADDAAIAKLTKRHGEIFKAKHLAAVTPFPHAAALLRHVHDRGQRVVLASSADAKEVAHYVNLLGIRDIVDATTSIDDVETSKPAGDIFAAALKKVKLAPAQVIVVGDTPYDVEAAAKCEIAAIAVRSGEFDEAVLRESGPIALYDHVGALLEGYDASPLAQ